MEGNEQSIKPPVNPLTVKINMAVLAYYFDWFTKRYLPAFKPVITSSYRAADKNKEVGGAENSAHLHGLAYDFVLQYPNGEPVPKAQAKSVFADYIAPNWHGFALWEENAAGVYHVHVNLSRKITEYSGIMGLAAMGVIGFHLIQKMTKGGD